MKEKKKGFTEMRVWRCILAGMIIWLFATVIFIYTLASNTNAGVSWILFVIAAPISMIFFCLFGKGLLNNLTMFILSSCIMWLIFVSAYLSLLVLANYNFWQLFFVGIPIEVIIFLTYRMKGLPKIQIKGDKNK